MDEEMENTFAEWETALKEIERLVLDTPLAIIPTTQSKSIFKAWKTMKQCIVDARSENYLKN